MTQRDMPDDAALDALVRRWRKHSNCNPFAASTVDAITALRAQNAALQARDEIAEAGDYFGRLVIEARSAATKACAKFPQPNYVTLKIAEEAGDEHGWAA